MVTTWRRVIATTLMGGALLLTGYAQAASDEDESNVYLLRGGLNIFSLGLDALSDKLDDAGVDNTVMNFGKWRETTKRILSDLDEGMDPGPIVIMGHSWGANAALLMADQLGRKGVDVDLVVTFDLLNDIKATSNVRRVINFYVEGGGVPVAPGPGFNGELENVNVRELDRGIYHLNIEKDDGLHEQTIEAVVASIGGPDDASADE